MGQPELRFKQLPIDEESKGNLIKIRTDMFFDMANDLAEQLYTGDISIGEFQETMKAEIRQLHTSNAAIGKGGWERMNSQSWGRLGPVLKREYQFLSEFANHISENRDDLSLKYLQNRARLYGHGSLQSAVLIEAPLYIADLLPVLPKSGVTRCLVKCHCRWELDVVSTKGLWQIVECRWTLGEAEHCEDCVEFSRVYDSYVIRVPVDVEVPSTIGGY